MTHLDPNELAGSSQFSALRAHVVRQLHHTQFMLVAAAIAAVTIVGVAATFMAAAL